MEREIKYIEIAQNMAHDSMAWQGKHAYGYTWKSYVRTFEFYLERLFDKE